MEGAAVAGCGALNEIQHNHVGPIVGSREICDICCKIGGDTGMVKDGSRIPVMVYNTCGTVNGGDDLARLGEKRRTPWIGGGSQLIHTGSIRDDVVGHTDTGDANI